MFAVIKTGGKQYKVAADDVIRVETVAGETGDTVSFAEVLMVGSDDGITLGAPTVDGATVAGEILRPVRTRKVIAFKKRRRKNSRRTRGHRQSLVEIRITDILTEGKKPKDSKGSAKGSSKAKADEAGASGEAGAAA